MNHEEFLDSEEPAPETTAGFEIEANVRHYEWVLAMDSRSCRVKRMKHKFVEECADHFWGKQFSAYVILGCVGYMGREDVVNAHPGCTNVVTIIPRHSVDKVV